MKKFLAIVLAFILLLGALTACNPNEDPSSNGSEKKVAVLVHDMRATYASWLAQSFEELAENYPFTVTIIDCKDSMDMQAANIENCVTKKYDYIIAQAVDVEALSSVLNRAIEAGVPCCTVNCTNKGAEKASCVDCDPVQQGSIPAAEALKRLPDDAKVVVLLGPSGNPHSIGRREGFQKVLFDAKPNIEILDEQIGNWYKEEGMELMENWLQKYDRIDAVISMNDAMALGCIEAAKAVGREHEMTYYGVDGLADVCLSIKDGEFTATCVQNAYAQAQAALDIAARVLAGEIERQTILVEGELIDASNVDHWIEIHTANGQIK